MSNDSFKYTPDNPAAAVPRHKQQAAEPTPKKHIPWSPFAAVVYSLAVYFSAQLIGSVLVIIYPHLMGWNKARANAWLDQSIVAQFWFTLSVEALTFGAIWWFIRSRGAGLRLIGWRMPRWKDPLYTLCGFAAYFVAYIILLALVSQFFPALNLNQKQDLGFTNPAGGFNLVLTFLSLVVLPPLAEETVFRGFVFTGLRGRMRPLYAGLLTSVLFASAHLEFGSGHPLLWVAAIDTFSLSLVLCYLRQKTDSLWPGILLHALKNGIAFVSLYIIAAH
jgi:membrane protease YdiL (CAAX protease family)